MNTAAGSASRRSARSLHEVSYDNDTAELTVDLSNIRKLLNFTSNRPEGLERPQKRIKRDQVKCVCSLTIWDNRPGGEPVVKRNVSCTLTTVDNGIYGPCVFVYLDKPFVIRAGDLKVNVDRDGETVLEVIDNYFLEIKIIPTRPDIDWPPIPLLGKSDGDHYVGPEKLNPESLKGALVMKYREIPKAPDSNVPLKAFFLQDGITFKTKYGLEVSAMWTRPTDDPKITDEAAIHPDIAVPHSPSRELSSTRAGSSRIENAQEHLPANAPSQGRAGRRRRKVKVIFHFESNTCRSHEVLPQYRTAEIRDFKCPACPRHRARDLDELRFHFLSSHLKYNFALVEVKEDEESGEVLEAVFEVTAIPPPRPSSNLRPDQKKGEFQWLRRATHFDLAAFLEGDTSWGSIGEATKINKALVRKTSAFAGVASEVVVVADPATDHRSQNDGFLSAQNVQEFQQPNIKKYPVIKLIRRIDDRVASYTSISHRATSPSEEPLSDSDDEVDDEWLIQRHLEDLDIAAKEDAWNPMKRELFRRWDKHRLHEKLEHTRYISDSLIRFVRREKTWLATVDAELQAALEDLLAQLTRARFINARVVSDIQQMVSDAKQDTSKASTREKDAMTNTNPKPSTTGTNGNKTTSTASLTTIDKDQLKLVHIIFKVLDKQGDLDSQTGLTNDQFDYFIDLEIPRPQLDTELRRWKPPPTLPAEENPPASFAKPAIAHTLDPPTYATPQEEISAWRASVLAVPTDHCGNCAQPILKRITEGMHCSAANCVTANTWFHLKCVKMKKRRLDWICRACRAEMKLKMEVLEQKEQRQEKGKGKGKERAVG